MTGKAHSLSFHLAPFHPNKGQELRVLEEQLLL